MQLPCDHVIVDFQSLISSTGQFIVKELAVLRGSSCQVWFFAPPNDEIMSEKARRTNHFLSTKFHGVSLWHGDVPYEKLTEILVLATDDASFVLCKGLEKCKFLQRFIPHDVIDLNLLDCPKNYSPDVDTCLHHRNATLQCAFRNCLSIAVWYRGFLRYGTRTFHQYPPLLERIINSVRNLDHVE